MNISTKLILDILKVLTWVIFIGLCIMTGAMIISTVVSMINPVASKDIYLGLDLSEFYAEGLWDYLKMASLIIAVQALKAYMFYLVIKLFSALDLGQPFTPSVGTLLIRISRSALEIGIVAIIGNIYANSYLNAGIRLEHDWEGGPFLFLAGIIFVIAHIFKRGLELQHDNELTV